VKYPIEIDPRPRNKPGKALDIAWPVQRPLQCQPIIPPSVSSFAAVIESRRSERQITRAPLREIVNMVAFATQPRSFLADDLLKRTRRPTPSAGALHPIDIALVDWRGAMRLMRYDAFSHRLDILRPVRGSDDLLELRETIEEMAPRTRGTALVLLGDIARVAAIYKYPETLFWRDAGALLQTLCLAATAFRLACCPLGILGYEVVQALGLEQRLTAAGILLVGRPLRNST
jgi:Nitroreductase family